MKNFQYWLQMTVIFMALGAMVTGFWMRHVEANPPIEFFNIPFPTTEKAYHPGDAVEIYAEWCRYTDKPVTRFVEFRDALILPIPPIQRAGGSAGCGKGNVVAAIIPDGIPPGTYHIFAKSEYKINPLAHRVVEWRTVEFEVRSE